MKESIVVRLFKIWMDQGTIMRDGVSNFLYNNECTKVIDDMMHDILENKNVIGEDLISYLTEE